MGRREAVFEALDAALDNGYDDLLLWGVRAIADDLGTFDAELEGLSLDELRPHIEAWKAARGS